MAPFKDQVAELRAVREEIFKEVVAASQRNGGEVKAAEAGERAERREGKGVVVEAKGEGCKVGAGEEGGRDHREAGAREVELQLFDTASRGGGEPGGDVAGGGG